MRPCKILGFTVVLLFPALFLWRICLYTDKPDLEEFTSLKPPGLCSYRNCRNTAQALHPVTVAEKTEAQVNRITVFVGIRTFPLCSVHARNTVGRRWPQQGVKWFLGIALWLFLSGFVSLGMAGLGFYVLMSRKKRASLPKAKAEPSSPGFRSEKRTQGSVTILRK